jgi:guanyl-specific ribonuclease Sa
MLYPFGMGMAGRSLSSDKYLYSINGQEKTPEIAPNTTTAEFWQYDARIGRRWNVDPVPKEYESPYAAFGNNPIWNIDPDGADSLKFLNNNQALDAMKIASKTLKGASDKKQKPVTQGTSKTASTLTSEIKGSLVDGASAYAEKNKLGLGADAEFNNLVQEYAEALRQGYKNSGSVFLDQVAKYLDACGNSKTTSTVALKSINAYINKEENDYLKKFNATREIGVQLVMLSMSYGTLNVGSGLKGTSPRTPFVPSGGNAALVPQKAVTVANYVEANGGVAMTGYKGGRTFMNSGSGGGQVLPRAGGGNPITYREYDINPYVKGVNRGAERVVTGSDGSRYYTGDHYQTFTKF